MQSKTLSRKRPDLAARNFKHGLAVRGHAHPLYAIWIQMRRRCLNPKHPDWKHYGGRGIRVCSRWRNFAKFVADMGERPPGLEIDRRNNDGHYTPGNCRWATRTEQNRNRRRRAS